jgi:hypothetical protein
MRWTEGACPLTDGERDVTTSPLYLGSEKCPHFVPIVGDGTRVLDSALGREGIPREA